MFKFLLKTLLGHYKEPSKIKMKKQSCNLFAQVGPGP